MAYDFPNAPLPGQVFQNWTWDSEKWVQTGNPAASGAVRYDLPQGLNTNQMAQGRANIGDTKRNYILNGAMAISQENGLTAGSAVGGYYPVDQFNVSASGTTGVLSTQQVASFTPSGSATRIRSTVTTADAAVAAGDIVWIETRLEGLRVNDLRYGSAVAKTTTLQFGVKAPAGTYSVVFSNSAFNRSYVAEYVVAAGEANTDAVKSVTIPGDVSGTWLQDNTVGLSVRWGLMAGTTLQQAAGSWGTLNAVGSPNQFNFMGTGGNVFELFDVSLTEGNIAPPFQVPDYASELALCKRYWRQVGLSARWYNAVASANFSYSYNIGTDMRASPTITVIAGGVVNNAAAFTLAADVGGGANYVVTMTSGGVAADTYVLGRSFSLNARL